MGYGLCIMHYDEEAEAETEDDEEDAVNGA